MKLKHYDNLGDARFITFCCHKKLPLLTTPQTINPFLQELNAARSKHRFSVLAYVIMPDHVHLVLLPNTSLELGRAIGQIKSRSARAALAALRNTASTLPGPLAVFRSGRERIAFWQRRCYDHNCRTRESVLQCIEYCHRNPVKRGLVKKAEEWPWSSAGAYTGCGGPIAVAPLEI